MSQRSSSYSLRDASSAKRPSRYLEYETSSILDSPRRSQRSRQRNEATTLPAVEQSASQDYERATSTLTRIYASGTSNSLQQQQRDVKFECVDYADQMATEELVMLEGYDSRPQQQQSSQPSSEQRNAASQQRGTELSPALKQNLRNLKNVLKLPKPRTFVYGEFFYSAVDRQLFLDENEFAQIFSDLFPNLKTTKLRLAEWQEVRRLVGRPRRLSQDFLNEERKALAARRRKIRAIYNGTCMTLAADHDLPKKLPRQPVVGMKVYARIRAPKDGVYAGTIDAILNEGYRVQFEKQEVIPTSVVHDTEVMTESPLELLSINYFLEMNSACNKSAVAPSHSKPTFVIDPRRSQLVSMTSSPNQPPTYTFQSRSLSVRDEKIGNFPLRMLVIMVKLFKVLEHKKLLVQNLTWMNEEAEKQQMLTTAYPITFKERYAEVLRELEAANKLLESYMQGIEEYNDLLVANLSAPQTSDRPDQLRKTQLAQASQLVKHCNIVLDNDPVRSKASLSLISKLVAIMLQVRQLGLQRKHHMHYEMYILAESLNQIKSELSPNNMAHWQTCVEVPMKQIYLMMQSKVKKCL